MDKVGFLLTHPPLIGKLIWGPRDSVFESRLDNPLLWVRKRCQEVSSSLARSTVIAHVSEILLCKCRSAKVDLSALIEQKNLVEFLSNSRQHFVHIDPLVSVTW